MRASGHFRSSSNRHTNRHKTCALHGIPPSARVRPRPSWPSACARGRCVLTHVAPLLAAAQPSGSLDPRTLYTMREAVSLHMGQSGVQTGNACWELYVSALTRPTEHQRPADPGLSGDASCVVRAADRPRWLRCAATAWSTGSSRTARCPPTRYAPPTRPSSPASSGRPLDLAAARSHYLAATPLGPRPLDGPLLRRGA